MLAIMGLVVVRELAVSMARVAAQVPAFRDVKEAIINSSLVKESSSNSSSRVIKAIRSS